MLTIEEIKSAIEKLSVQEFIELRNWIIERDWGKWDKEIEKHSRQGLLNFLVEEALEEKRTGKLKQL